MKVFKAMLIVAIIAIAVVSQEVHIKGDLLNREIINTNGMPPVHQQYEGTTTNRTFVVMDTVVQIEKVPGEGCSLIAEVPSHYNYLISSCKGSTQLLFEHIADSVMQKKEMLSANQSGFKIVDASPLYTYNTTHHAAVSIWSGDTSGNAKVAIHLFNDTATGNSTWFDVTLADSTSTKFKNPRVAGFCATDSSCKALVYDFNGTSKCTIKVYELTTTDTPILKYLADTEVGPSFPNMNIFTGLVVQSAETVTFSGMSDSGVYNVIYNMSSDGTLKRASNGSSNKEINVVNSRLFVSYTKTRSHTICAAVHVQGNLTNSIFQYVKFDSQRYIVQKYQMPSCMKLASDNHITYLQFKGIQGSATYADSKGNPVGHAIFFKDPSDGEIILGRCIESTTAVSTFYNTQLSELVTVDKESTTYYSVNIPTYRLNTASLPDGVYKFEYSSKNLGDSNTTKHTKSKSIRVFSDPFNMPTRVSPFFKEAWLTTETAEIISSKNATSLEISKNDILCNGCDAVLVGDNVDSYSTKMSKVQYNMAIGSQLTGGIARAVILKRDFVLVSDDKANRTSEIWKCVQDKEEARTCTILNRFSFSADTNTAGTEGFIGAYAVASRSYWTELTKSLGSDQKPVYYLRTFDMVKSELIYNHFFNDAPVSSFWRTNGDDGLLLTVTLEPQITLRKYAMSKGKTMNTVIQVHTDITRICIKDIAASQHDTNEFWVYSECDTSTPYVQKFYIDGEDAYPVQSTFQKLAKAEGRMHLCNLHTFLLYVPASMNDVKVISSSGDILNYNFPSDAKEIIHQACVPEAGIHLSIRERLGKNYLIAIGFATNEYEEAAERFVTVIELEGVTNPRDYLLSAVFDRRDMCVHAMLVKKSGFEDQKLTVYKIAIDDGQILIKSKDGNKLGAIKLKITMKFDSASKAGGIKYRSIDQMNTPEIENYKVMPTNKAGVFDLNEYASIEGNYFGVEVTGPDANKIEIKDRLRSNSSKLPAGIVLDGIVVSAGEFMATSKLGEGLELRKDPLTSSAYLKLEELSAVDEAIMVRDHDTGHVLLVARMETIDGNRFVIYWLEKGQSLPSLSRNLKSHQWKSSFHLIRMNFFATKILEGKSKHFVLSAVSESRRAALIFFFNFAKDFSALIGTSVQPFQHRSIIEDVYMNSDRIWIYIKQRGNSFLTLKINEATGDSIISMNVRVHRAIENAVVIAVYCLRTGPIFCMYETHARYILVENETIKKIYPKLAGYETAAWLSTGEYLGLLLRTTWQRDSPASYVIVLYRHKFNGIYTKYDIGEIDDVVLGENLMNSFALVESAEGVVLVTSSRLKKREKLLLQTQEAPSFPLVANKIEVNIKADNLIGDSLKFSFKSGDPSEQPVVKGIFVESTAVNPDEPSKSGSSTIWIVLAILVILIIVGCIAYCMIKNSQQSISHRKSVMTRDTLIDNDDLEDERL